MVQTLKIDSTGNEPSTVISNWTERVLAWVSQQETLTERQLNNYVLETLPSSIPLDDSFGAVRNIVIDVVHTYLDTMGKSITIERMTAPVQKVIEANVNSIREQQAQTITASAPVTPVQESEPATVEVPQQKSILQEPSAQEPQHDDLSIENQELLEEVIAEVDLPEDSAESDMTLLNGTFHQVLDRTDKRITDTVLDFSEEDIFDLEEIGITREEMILPTKAKPGSEQKVRMIAGRYAHGLPLWHEDDLTCLEPRPGAKRTDED